MRRSVILASALTLFSCLLFPLSAKAETVDPSEWWRNCGLWKLTDNCVESIEFFNELTQSWQPTLPEKNPDWVPNWTITEDYRQTRNKIDPVVGQCGHHESISAADCYLAKGAGSKGEDLLLQSVIYGKTESIKINFVAFNGQLSYIRPGVGDRLFLLPPNSKWRVTIVSDLFGNDAGIATAQMKDPSFEVLKGSDGKTRIRAEGRVQEIYTLEPRNPGDPSCDDIVGKSNEFTSNRYETNFSINISRYQYEYEKLKGSPPAGVFITENGGCFSRLQFDTQRRIISVAMGAPHFDINGKVIEGWVQASIRGDVVRKAFNADPKTMNEALIEVTYTDGTTKPATSSTKYVAETDKVEIRAYGFTFSAPTVKMTLRPVEAKKSTGSSSSSTSSSKSASSKNSKVSEITCKKGKQEKKVTAIAPKKPACPKGWSKA